MIPFPVNDADGHITESSAQLRPYLEGREGERSPWARRDALHPVTDGIVPSAASSAGNVSDAKTWLKVMDEGNLETTILYPTAGLAIGWVRESDFAVALCRATTTSFTRSSSP